MDQRFGPPANEEQRLIMEHIQAEQERIELNPELTKWRQPAGVDLQIHAEPPQTLTQQANPSTTSDAGN